MGGARHNSTEVPRIADGHFRLRTLGRLALVDVDGREEPSLATRPRKLAVLAWLALRPDRHATRDRLVGVFWGERDEQRARNSLSDALSHLRRALGRDTIVTRGDAVELAAGSPLVIDALELSAAAAAGDHARVVALFAGPFLDGVYVDDAQEFDDWRDRERARLAALFARSAAVHCADLARAGRWDDCHALAEQWLDVEAASAEAGQFLLRSIAAPGTPEALGATIGAYDSLVKRLDRDLGVPPHASVTALMREAASTLAANPPAPRTAVSPASVSATTASPLPADQGATRATTTTTPSETARRPYRRLAASAGMALAAVTAVVLAASRRPEPTLAARRVAVAPFDNRTGDSALAPLGRIASDWIARGLLETHVVEVVEPTATPSAGTVGTDPRALARDEGAALLLLGAYFRQGDSISVEARLVDVRTGRVLRAVPPATSLRTEPLAAVNVLRQRVAGAIAAELDLLIAGLARDASQPPTYDAYLAWVQGLDVFSHHDYRGAIPFFLRAAALDSSFDAPRVWAVAAYGNAGEWARCDSLAHEVNRARPRLAPGDRGLLDFWLANIAGDLPGRYAAARTMLDASPTSELALFMTGLSALSLDRPNEAVALLRRIPIDRSGVRWDMYGTGLAAALHVAGRYDEELVEARRRRARQPDWLRAIDDEARALVALGRLEEADRLMTAAAALPVQVGRSPATTMFATALELRAHGHERAAVALSRRAAEWTRTHLPADSGAADARYELARQLAVAAEWTSAETIFRALRPTRPYSAALLGWIGVAAATRGDVAEADQMSSTLAALRVPYLKGANTMARARIAAALGRPDDAVRLARQAISEGTRFEDLHGMPEFAALRGYPKWEVLTRPAG